MPFLLYKGLRLENHQKTYGYIHRRFLWFYEISKIIFRW